MVELVFGMWEQEGGQEDDDAGVQPNKRWRAVEPAIKTPGLLNETISEPGGPMARWCLSPRVSSARRPLAVRPAFLPAVQAIVALKAIEDAAGSALSVTPRLQGTQRTACSLPHLMCCFYQLRGTEVLLQFVF